MNMKNKILAIPTKLTCHPRETEGSLGVLQLLVKFLADSIDEEFYPAAPWAAVNVELLFVD